MDPAGIVAFVKVAGSDCTAMIVTVNIKKAQARIPPRPISSLNGVTTLNIDLSPYKKRRVKGAELVSIEQFWDMLRAWSKVDEPALRIVADTDGCDAKIARAKNHPSYRTASTVLTYIDLVADEPGEPDPRVHP